MLRKRTARPEIQVLVLFIQIFMLVMQRHGSFTLHLNTHCAYNMQTPYCSYIQ